MEVDEDFKTIMQQFEAAPRNEETLAQLNLTTPDYFL